jgi:hypothetical protein
MPLRINFGWTLAGNVVYAGCQWAILVAIAQLASPDAVGKFSLGLAVTAPVFLFAGLHLRASQATDAARGFRFADYFGVRLGGMIAALVATAAIVALSGYDRETGLVVLAVAASKAIEGMSDVYYGLSQQNERMRPIAVSLVWRGVLSVLAVGAVLWCGGGILLAAVALGASWMAVLLAYDRRAAAPLLRAPVPRRPFRPGWRAAGRIVAVCFPLGLVMMLLSLRANIPRYFIQNGMGPAELGVFAALSSLLTAGNVVVSALGQSAMPRLARHYHERDLKAFRRLLTLLLAMAGLVGGAGLAVTTVAGEPLVGLVFGELREASRSARAANGGRGRPVRRVVPRLRAHRDAAVRGAAPSLRSDDARVRGGVPLARAGVRPRRRRVRMGWSDARRAGRDLDHPRAGAPQGRRGSRIMTALRVCWLTALLAIVLLVPGAVGPIAAASIWAACMAVLVRLGPNGFLSLPPLYLLMLGVFHLGLVVPMALGAKPAEVPDWIASPQLDTALSLVTAACLAFTLGAARAPTRVQEKTSPLPSQRQLVQIGMPVAVIGAAFLWIGVWQLGILSSGYGEYFERALVEDVRFFGFGLMLFPIGVLVASVGATPRQMFVLGGMTLVVLGPLFVSGFRGPTIVLAMALLAVWTHKQRLVARGLTIGVLATAIVLVPAIRLTRDDRSSTGVPNSLDPLAPLFEAGGSLSPLVVTAEIIQSGSERLWMGRSWAMALERIVPNVGARVATGDASRTPYGWATLYADPSACEAGDGGGFSGVAEPYVTFGGAGVVVFFLLRARAPAVRPLAREPPFRAAIAAASFKSVLWTVRNDAMEPPRSIAFASVVVLAAWVVTRLSARHRRPARRFIEMDAPPVTASAPAPTARCGRGTRPRAPPGARPG